MMPVLTAPQYVYVCAHAFVMRHVLMPVCLHLCGCILSMVAGTISHAMTCYLEDQDRIMEDRKRRVRRPPPVPGTFVPAADCACTYAVLRRVCAARDWLKGGENTSCCNLCGHIRNTWQAERQTDSECLVILQKPVLAASTSVPHQTCCARCCCCCCCTASPESLGHSGSVTVAALARQCAGPNEGCC